MQVGRGGRDLVYKYGDSSWNGVGTRCVSLVVGCPVGLVLEAWWPGVGNRFRMATVRVLLWRVHSVLGDQVGVWGWHSLSLQLTRPNNTALNPQKTIPVNPLLPLRGPTAKTGKLVSVGKIPVVLMRFLFHDPATRSGRKYDWTDDGTLTFPSLGSSSLPLWLLG